MSVAQWFQNMLPQQQRNLPMAQTSLTARPSGTTSLEALDATTRRVVEVVYNTSLKYHCVPDQQHSGQIFRVFSLERPGRMAFLFLGNAVPRPHRGTLQSIATEVGGILKSHPVVYDPAHGSTAIQIGLDPMPERRKVLPSLPALIGYQVVVVGPTGSGKSTACRHIARERVGEGRAINISLDPHYEPGQWHPSTIVIGAGGRFADVMESLRQLEIELHRRLDMLAEGHKDFVPVTVTVDELYALQESETTAGTQLITLAQQGRKVGLFFILAPHDDTVQAMGMEGKGGARDNFVFVKLSLPKPGEKHKPRVARVFAGSPRTRNAEFLGEYLIATPIMYQGHARRLQNLTGVFTGAEVIPWLSGTDKAASASIARDLSTVPESVPDVPNINPQPVPNDVPAIGTPRNAPDHAAYEQKYARGTVDAARLARYLAEQGFSLRRIVDVIPGARDYRVSLVQQAKTGVLCSQQVPPQNSAEEQILICDLHDEWDMPGNLLERLFHTTAERVKFCLEE